MQNRQRSKVAIILKGDAPGADRLRRELSGVVASSVDIALHATQCAGHAIELARALAPTVDYLVAAGGDGTLNEVLEGALRNGAGRQPVFGLLALGTANDFLKSAGGDGTLRQCLQLIARNHSRPVDIGLVTCSGGRRHFVNVADIGIGAEVVQELSRGRRRFAADLYYFRAIVRAFMRFRKATLRISSDRGLDWQGRCLALLAANGRCFGSGLVASPDARFDSGELAVTLIGDVSVFDFLRKLPALRAGRSIEHPQVSYHRACSLEVSHSDRAYGVEVDGEFLGQTPARIEVNASAVRMLLP